MKFEVIQDWKEKEFQDLLLKHHLIEPKDLVVSAQSAGQGNMNFTFRARMKDGRSFIVKQAPPYCAKFPMIPAPVERISVENQFYQLAAKSNELKHQFPLVHFIDSELNLLVMEDFGESLDFEFLYLKDKSQFPQWKNHIKTAFDFLNGLHQISVPSGLLHNQEMQKLNHQYIFSLPFDPADDFNADSAFQGMGQPANKIKANPLLREVAIKIGKLYLGSGKDLCHGDYYPKSWLMVKKENLKVIDPEFAFLGFREFDLGVLKAHLLMSHISIDEIQDLFKSYLVPFDLKLTNQVAGIEVIRRLTHIAQLPLDANLQDRLNWLAQAETWMKS